MMNQKQKTDFSGWLILDKPAGITSAQAVGRVKRLLHPRKIGHGGTLDPMATGILPLALNEATKAFQFVVANSKAYRFTVQWGSETTTDDAEGEVTHCTATRPSQAQIEEALSGFIGEIMQVPPAFSAIKVEGKRSYALARAGTLTELAARPVMVRQLRLLEVIDANHAVFEMECGKGTYVRAIARDLGRKIGCLAHVSTLRRIKVGDFDESSAISLEELEDLVHSAAVNEWLMPVSSVLADIPALELDPQAARRMRNGQPVISPVALQEGDMVQVISDRVLIAVAHATDDGLRPVRVFNLA